MTKIAFIGLGHMGGGMAPNLVKAGHDVAAFDLSDEAEDDEGDELVLDADDILTSPVGSAPIAPPSDDEETAETGEPTEQPKLSAGGGSTLFERMSNMARGAPKAKLDEDEGGAGFSEEPLDIPRFLNRQNNQ